MKALVRAIDNMRLWIVEESAWRQTPTFHYGDETYFKNSATMITQCLPLSDFLRDH